MSVPTRNVPSPGIVAGRRDAAAVLDAAAAGAFAANFDAVGALADAAVVLVPSLPPPDSETMTTIAMRTPTTPRMMFRTV